MKVKFSFEVEADTYAKFLGWMTEMILLGGENTDAVMEFFRVMDANKELSN